ncbi:Endonuclease/exonuclease/phosphatase [Cynara cardunculus var. scolymus]|uniref:Endonuclease/exonuclease/phosphatase n=1 Tax=Cynara cardunculus var. scolymus TaxID=59895 RepID=A0A103XTV5_CYNCS|nr:Endonuclease/exonuclease/phosphatase [Cynara cardunculus var. scolymus]
MCKLFNDYFILEFWGLASEAKRNWIRNLRTGNKANFLALQESHLKDEVDFDSSNLSGVKVDFAILDGFVAVWGRWVSYSIPCGFINVYAPQSSVSKLRFNDFIRDSGLIEVRSGGRKFTKMSANGAKHSKLDKYLVSSNFLSHWPMPSAMILPRYLSDHCPILFRSALVDFGPIYFKFFNSWLGQPDFNLLVLDSWNSSPSTIYCLPIKYFINIKAENTPLSLEEIASRKDILMKIKPLDEENVKDLKQKARLRWVVDGEENSSFFHGIVNSNRRSNFIHDISSNGVWITDPSEVKQTAFNFVSERFRSRCGRFSGLWRNILKIHKEYNKLNLPFADWFQREQSSNRIDFSWRWALDSHGTLPVSSMRAAYDDLSLHQVSFQTSWWVNWVPTKINILAWRLLHKRLPTKNNLIKRGVVCLSSLCPLCECAEEDEEHLFIGCSISRQLLKDLCIWWKVDIGQVNSIGNLLDRSSEVAATSMCKKAFIGVVYGFFWIIWILRNHKIFLAPNQNSASFLVGQLQAYSYFWFKNRASKDVMANSWIEWCNSPMSCF